MKLSKELKAFFQEAVKGDSYWVEKAKLEFAMGLEKQRRHAQMTYAAIAEKIGTSAAYITKVFRGDSNLTIESMVKLARATGGELELKIVERNKSAFVWDATTIKAAAHDKPTLVPTATVYSLVDYAANHDHYVKRNPFKEAA